MATTKKTTTTAKTAVKKTATKKAAPKKAAPKKKVEVPQHIGLVRDDSWLEPFEGAIRGRHDHALWKIGQLTRNGKQTLSQFASGHLYFGRGILSWMERNGKAPAAFPDKHLRTYIHCRIPGPRDHASLQEQIPRSSYPLSDRSSAGTVHFQTLRSPGDLPLSLPR